MKKSVAILLFTAFSGCIPLEFGPGAKDFEASLPNGYIIHRMNATDVFIAKGSSHSDNATIPAEVVELDHDDHFLIAKQRFLDDRGTLDSKIADNKAKPDAFQYWIIDLLQDKVIGPMGIDEFDNTCKRLGVSRLLQLHTVYDYKPTG